MPTDGNMKTRTILFLQLLALAAAGCGTEPGGVEPGGGNCIEIIIPNLHPSLDVKATAAGDDAYNENLVSNVDLFFYPSGGSGSNAVIAALGRGAEAVAQGDSTVYKVKVYFSAAEAEALLPGSATSCDVYAVCNAPITYDLSHSSVPELKELVVEHDFPAQTVQGSFVMRSSEVSAVSFERGDGTISGSGRIEVYRLASKLQLFLKIPSTYIDSQNREWEPVPDAGIQVQMVNVVKKDKLDGDYAIQEEDYVSYGNRFMAEIPQAQRISGYEDYSYGHVPFYSYSSEWKDLSDYAASFVFRIQWKRKPDGDPEWRVYQISPNSQDTRLEPNVCYRTFVNVLSIGGLDKDYSVVIPEGYYDIIPWMNDGNTSGGGQGLIPGELSTYKYLVFDRPDISVFNQDEAKYTCVSSSSITGATVTRIVHHDYSSASPDITVNSPDTGVLESNRIEVDTSNPGYITVKHPLAGVYCEWDIYVDVTNGDGITETIHLNQLPSMYIQSVAGGNPFVDGYFAYVKDGKYADGVTSGGSVSNTGTYTDMKTSPSVGATSTTDGSTGTVTTPYSILRRYGVVSDYTLLDLTRINVTSFSSGSNTFTSSEGSTEYVIGDPRQKSGWTSADLANYLYNTAETRAWTAENGCDAADIMVGTTRVDVIAPSLLFSSAWNSIKGGSSISLEDAKKRCATYQEGGYPAGRWRLPTEAEINYALTLQGLGKIQTLFGDKAYYSSSGKAYDGSEYSTTSSGAVRCVYDVWYWGDDPMDPSWYHPLP